MAVHKRALPPKSLGRKLLVFCCVPEPGFYSIEKWVNFRFAPKEVREVNIDLYQTQAKLNGKNTPRKRKPFITGWTTPQVFVPKAVFFDQTLSNYEDFFPDFRTYLFNGPAEGQKKFEKR